MCLDVRICVFVSMMHLFSVVHEATVNGKIIFVANDNAVLKDLYNCVIIRWLRVSETIINVLIKKCEWHVPVLINHVCEHANDVSGHEWFI